MIERILPSGKSASLTLSAVERGVPMKKVIWQIALVLTIALLCVTAAQAAVYTITLKNGTSFDSRYRPVDAEWDENVSMFVTDQGNWIALEKAEIADVTSAVEVKGFGYQLDTTTVVIGWSPNDLARIDENGESVQDFEFIDDVNEGQNFTIEQFVNPTSVGDTPVGGIPLYGGSGTPLGGNGPVQ
jgi:hypothetical protein